MRIYISSTYEDLLGYRQAVISALQRSGHTPVCMEHHAATNRSPKDESLTEVRSCKVYIGIFAWRYGFVPPQCEFSFTELEYREALNHNIPTLIFLLDEKADWPQKFRDSGINGEYIKKLREELKLSKWIRTFSSPDNLATEVLAAISSLFPVIPTPKSLPIPIPDRFISHFTDREDELTKLLEYLSDKSLRMVSICGRGGIGKTSLVTKLIQCLTRNCLDEVSDTICFIEGIVYISLGETCYRTLDRIIELISRAMNDEAAGELKGLWQQDGISLQDRLAELFEGPLTQHRLLIIFDNLESIMDENRIIKDYTSLGLFIEAFLEYNHSSILIATSRQVLSLSPAAEIASIGRWIKFSLDKGLPENFAISLLRKLDSDGRLGILDTSDEQLSMIASRCLCIPRTLETLVATLLQHPTWTLNKLIANEQLFSRLIEQPARELYASLSSNQERLVIHALAVYGKPITSDAIYSIFPEWPIDQILDALFRNFVVNHHQGRFWLHPIDRQYAYDQIPDQGTGYSKPKLHNLAANYFLSVSSTTKYIRASFEDAASILDALDHFLAAGQTDNAAELFIDNGLYEDLFWWGYFNLLADLCYRFLSLNISSNNKIILHIQLGKVQRNFGNLEEAKKTYENGLSYVDNSVDVNTEISLNIALGDINFYLGDLNSALKFHQIAEQLLSKNPNPKLQSENTGDMANVISSMKKYNEALEMYELAILFSRQAGNKIHEGIWHGGLGVVHSSLFFTTGDALHREKALSNYFEAIEIAREKLDRRHESHWNGVLGNFFRQLGEYDKAEDHLRKALSVARGISYGRMIQKQSTWLITLFNERLKRCIHEQDFDTAFNIVDNYEHLINEICVKELCSEINFDGYRSSLYQERGNANARNGKIEEAIRDYGECIFLNPKNIGASFSRAEVQIWAGKYSDAKISLDYIEYHLNTTIEKLIYAWLMCHIQNLDGRAYSSYRKYIEDNLIGNIQINYCVTDIEHYLGQLDKAKFSDTQIMNAWAIQTLIKKFS